MPTPTLSTGDSPKAGTQSANSTPAALANNACISALIQNDPGSTNNLLVGDSSSQTIALQAGQAVTIPCSNLNQIYVATAAGTATCNWLIAK